jgi:hypothetical protein
LIFSELMDPVHRIFWTAKIRFYIRNEQMPLNIFA